MTKRYGKELTIEELAAMPEKDIDFSDIPESDPAFWSVATVRRLRGLAAEGLASGFEPWEGPDAMLAKVKERARSKPAER